MNVKLILLKFITVNMAALLFFNIKKYPTCTYIPISRIKEKIWLDLVNLEKNNDLNFVIVWLNNVLRINLGLRVSNSYKKSELFLSRVLKHSSDLIKSKISKKQQNILIISFLENCVFSKIEKVRYAIKKIQNELNKQLKIGEYFLHISQVVDKATEAICITDIDGFLSYANQTFLQLFKYSSIEDLNACGGLFTLFADRQAGEEVHNLVLNGYSWNGNVEMYACNGQLIKVALRLEEVENQTELKRTTRIIAVHTDITPSKQVEEDLRRTEDRLKLILEIAQISAWELNFKNREITWINNPNTVLGSNSIDISNKSNNLSFLLQCIHPDDRQKLRQALKYSLNEGVNYEVEFRLLGLDGSIHWIKSFAQILSNESDKATICMLGASLNITESKCLKEDLRRSIETVLAQYPDVKQRVMMLLNKNMF